MTGRDAKRRAYKLVAFWTQAALDGINVDLTDWEWHDERKLTPADEGRVRAELQRLSERCAKKAYRKEEVGQLGASSGGSR